jgi:hypothetical protein
MKDELSTEARKLIDEVLASEPVLDVPARRRILVQILRSVARLSVAAKGDVTMLRAQRAPGMPRAAPSFLVR